MQPPRTGNLLHLVTRGYTPERIFSPLTSRLIDKDRPVLNRLDKTEEIVMGKTTIVILIVLALLLVSGVAIARYKGFCSGPEGRIDRVTERIGKQLQLDDVQHLQLDQLKEKFVVIAHELRSDRSTYVDEAIDLLNTPALDREQAHTLLMRKQAQLASVSNELIDAFADFSDNLNQSQRNELQSMISHHREHRHCKFACGGGWSATQE
ncbi:MAG: periplasmic heavy metal sensor [Candidatus Thiodiazotropha sp. (ex Dulcina madagascariensis)]|nr:periplasmic heavy metal sensor [Candidatus Thiodiazotropha sp. (ex Dulcina madagascariensis)]MCU7925480.1 periplasmic heavy metal sensor [Candidatus Thiodiazotropha sp. (ex Dulcina madagascariensis)]